MKNKDMDKLIGKELHNYIKTIEMTESIFQEIVNSPGETSLDEFHQEIMNSFCLIIDYEPFLSQGKIMFLNGQVKDKALIFANTGSVRSNIGFSRIVAIRDGFGSYIYDFCDEITPLSSGLFHSPNNKQIMTKLFNAMGVNPIRIKDGLIEFNGQTISYINLFYLYVIKLIGDSLNEFEEMGGEITKQLNKMLLKNDNSSYKLI